MNEFTAGSLATILAYLVGSIPFGLLTGKFVRGIDIRAHGSGNIGATNVARVLGSKWGILVLFLDALKGMLPTLFLPTVFLPTDSSAVVHVMVLCGIFTIVGHMFPCYLKLRGGKGVATALGVITVLSWQATLIAFGAFLFSFLLSRIVSLSSIVAATAFGIAQFCFQLPEPFSPTNWSLTAFSLLIPALIIFRHRSNIGRILKGEEKKFRAGGKNA